MIADTPKGKNIAYINMYTSEKEKWIGKPRTAVSRAVMELATEGYDVIEYTYKGLFRINDRFIVIDGLQGGVGRMYDESSDWTKQIHPFTPKKEIKAFIKNWFKTLKSFDPKTNEPIINNQKELF